MDHGDGAGGGVTMEGTSHIKGLAEANAALKRLPDRVQRRVLRGATAAGARVMLKAVKAAAPTDAGPQSEASRKYGRLRDNLRVLRLKRGIPDTAAAYRVDTGKSFWGLFLEFGTRLISARPWFRPAVDSSTDKALDTIKDRLASGVAREAEKLAK